MLENRKFWRAIFEGDGTPPAGDPPAGEPPAGDPPKSFTQEQVDKIVTAEKDKLKRNFTKTIEDLEKYKKTANLSQEQVDSLTVQIETMRRENMTKEELAKEDLAKKDKEFNERLTTTETERDIWRGRYTEELITRALLDAAVTNDAYNPEQIIAVVRSNTRLDEEIVDGKKTGKFHVKVTVNTVDKDKKPVTLDLSAGDAVKKLKENVAYANLFKSSLKGGLNLNNTNTGNSDGKPLTTEEYIKQRAEAKKGKH